MDRYESGKEMYKLILMDYSMPILNGADSTKKIRDYLAQLNTIEVIYPHIICLTTHLTNTIK